MTRHLFSYPFHCFSTETVNIVNQVIRITFSFYFAKLIHFDTSNKAMSNGTTLQKRYTDRRNSDYMQKNEVYSLLCPMFKKITNRFGYNRNKTLNIDENLC